MSEKAIAIDIHETSSFGDLLALVAAGEEIVFEQNGSAVARLVRVPAKPRISGQKARMWQPRLGRALAERALSRARMRLFLEHVPIPPIPA